MKDEIIGTGVLDVSGPYHYLFYVRSVAKRDRLSVDDLPVLPEGVVQPELKLPSYYPENTAWRYKIDGDILHVHPSVLIKNYFHNEGQWSVKFVYAESTDRAKIWRQLAAHNSTLCGVNESCEHHASFSE